MFRYDDDAEWLTKKEVCAYLNCTPRWLDRALSERRFPYAKLGGLIRIDRRDVDAYLAANRVADLS